MDLIPAFTLFNVLASIPLVMMLVPLIKSALEILMANPLARAVFNTTLVVLESTELVWRPALKLSLAVIKTFYNALVLVLPQVKALVLNFINTTMAGIKKMQEMGVNVSQTLGAVLDRMGEFGDALIVLARGLTKLTFYLVRMMGSVVSAFEDVFAFGKKMMFEPNVLTMNDLYNIILPICIVASCISFLLWLKSSPKSSKSVAVYQPRRSSRIARKRAMILTQDLSESLPAC